jgi:carotenoid 1,2-hydratase
VSWDGRTLSVDIDERGAPLPFPVRGQVRVQPAGLTRQDFVLDVPPRSDDGQPPRHRWWPIAPCARVEVAMQTPSLRWSGPGYLDMNAGDEPLEQGFRDWDWSRGDLDGDTVIFYDPRGYDDSTRSIALRIAPTGEIEPLTAPPRASLPTTSVWRIPRAARGEPHLPLSLVRTLEDTPFYARSVIRTGAMGRPLIAMHESLMLTRFAAPWVQMLLPFRMPRIP